jgi:hypothetical protein
MRRALALLGALAAASTLSACSNSKREDVESYLKQANAIEVRSAPAFKRANAVYAAYSAGRLTPGRAARELAGAEASIRSARGQVARLDPPADARELHRRLLHLYDLDIGLAGETTALARYTPAAAKALRPLAAANKRLTGALRASAGKAEQQRALRSYAGVVETTAGDLRRLHPPPVLASSNRAEIAQLSAARSLALKLEQAIGAGDAQRVATLLLRFRRLGGTSSSGLAAGALRAYDRRYRAIGAAQTAVRQEELRLQKKLG